jgi:hypothetical protein
MMADFHSRYDYANYYIHNLPDTRYIKGDFMKFKEQPCDIITWFLPFLTEKPLLKWGLPLSYLAPEAMLKHAYKLLNSQGIILLVNQTEEEKAKQLKLLEQLEIESIEVSNSYTNHFSPFVYKRYITVVIKG